ncbi:MAG: hypothetical protein ACKOT0_05830 [bacterium]
MDSSISISLERARDKITVSGTTNLPPGTPLTVSIDVEGKGLKTAKQAVEVSGDGTFTWTRKLPQNRTAEVSFSHEGTASNKIAAGVWAKGS